MVVIQSLITCLQTSLMKTTISIRWDMRQKITISNALLTLGALESFRSKNGCALIGSDWPKCQKDWWSAASRNVRFPITSSFAWPSCHRFTNKAVLRANGLLGEMHLSLSLGAFFYSQLWFGENEWNIVVFEITCSLSSNYRFATTEPFKDDHWGRKLFS